MAQISGRSTVEDDPLNPRTFKVAALIRAARGPMSQHQFGQQVGGYSQSQISKYESGEDPPAALIERCMQMVAEKRDATFEISGPELAARLQKIMATPELTGVGHAIAAILAAVESRQVGRPNKRSAQN